MGIGGRSPHNTKRDTCFHRAGHGVDAAHGGDLERLALLHQTAHDDRALCAGPRGIGYAIGGFLLPPVLIRFAQSLSPCGWREGLVLAFFRWAPLAMLVTVGVGFAPASHVAALLPGLLPLFAASISYIFFGERLSIIRMLGLHSSPAARSRLFSSA